ncbi:auxin-induced in root cultures protein 12-like [Triticum dicoccoides]|uniref:auxin-induced in root cultures protein 12-like n=1 Tax=Triticum dicoccoides TaxID=85692 RepID=UPI00162C4AB6|nr:auxin-induced in root cultures protein 12-like [Triticum dicoccoides]
MASATQQHRRRRAILQLAALLVLVSPAAAAGGSCKSEKFPAGKSYETCADLPALGAALHWTYDAAASSLSVAFAAKPASGAGWVAWGINPTGDGMKGAQSLLAFKSGATYVVNTYNLTGYKPLSPASTPIAFKATGLAADEGAGGKVRLYGTLQLPKGMESVNHIWQVGSAVANGVPAKHAFAQENLDAKGKLVLAGARAPESAPAPAAGDSSAESGSVEAEAPSLPTPSGGKKSPPAGAASTTHASAPILIVLLALAGFLAIV